MNRVTSVLFAAAAIVTGISSSSAAMVYEANFDGATGTSISGVTGGAATLLGNSTVQTATPFNAVSGGYVDSQIGVSAKTGASLAPAAGNGLASWGGAGALTINGGLDFFMRPAATVTESRYMQHDGTTGQNSISFHSGWESSVFVEIYGGTYSNLAEIVGSAYGGTGGIRLGNRTATPLVAGETYHVGVTFSTDAANLVTGKLFIVPGTGEIDTTGTTGLTGHVAFSVASNEFGSQEIQFGNPWGDNPYGNKEATDFDAIRIYNATPASFPALVAVPEPASMAVLGLLPAALLRRRRNASR